MPTYEYECPEGHAFEKFQKISDKPRAKCPVCGKPGTRKISGGAGLVFRGSGFYITDYGKDGKGPRKPEAEKPAKPTESTGATSGSESKTKPESSSSKPATGKGGDKAPKE
jgi:putative FmdB family regulatory protein